MSRERAALILFLLFVIAIAGMVMLLIGSRLPTRQAPRLASLPTATWTTAPLSTAVPTAAPIPTETPSPTPVPRYGLITFGTGMRGEEILNPATLFSAGTREVYACWTYQDVVNGTFHQLYWFLDDNRWRDEAFAWDTTRYGSNGTVCPTHISEYDTDGLPPGNYRLELFIGEQQVQMATFVILAPTPTPAPPTATPQPDIQTVGRQAARSLVQIYVRSDRFLVQDKSGSGSIVDGEHGLIVTNWHVVSDWSGRLLNEEGYALVYLTADPDQPPNLTYWAQVLPQYSDSNLDLAILQITHWAADQAPVGGTLGLPAVPLGDSSLVHTGDHVLLLGFPNYAEGRLAWTEGAVTTHDDWWIKTDAETSHGHSGGMMLNERGELIGILTQVEETTTGGLLALARPVNLARPLIAGAVAAGRALPPSPPSPEGAAPGELMMVLGVERLNLRDGPGLGSQVVGEMLHGTVVEVLRETVWDGERFWYYVRVQGSTQEGWASGVYLAPWEVATSPILFTSDRAGSFDIYRVLPDGTGLAQLTSDPGNEGDPSWSPDHSTIVFTSNRNGNNDIFTMNAAGGPWMQLTDDQADDVHPVWSPTDSRIAFVSKRDGDWEIFSMNADGTGLHQVTFNDVWDSFPAWSPDGTRLVYTSVRTGNYDLYLIDLATGADQQLTTNPYSDAHPSWTPFGDEIVYTMVMPEGDSLLREIGVLNVYDPAHPRRVTVSSPGEARNGYADWSPDGRWIVFTSERDENDELYLIPAGGGWAANLTNAPFSGDHAPAWSR